MSTRVRERRLAASPGAAARIRPFCAADVPAVVALFQRVFPEHGWSSEEACASYFHHIFFDNPWRDPALPSWVADEESRITGFLGVLPRQMRFRGRTLRVAVGTQFMVAPERRASFTALELLKACLSGPQELSFADGANDASRRLWMALGGMAPLAYSVHWTRPLRPLQYMLSLSTQSGDCPKPLGLVARPAGALVDAAAARSRLNRFHADDGQYTDAPLELASMAAHLSEFTRGIPLAPLYDGPSLAWLMGEAARKRRHGTLRARAALDRAGRIAGWYVYYARSGGVSEVLQLAACSGGFRGTLQRLLVDAWREGSVAVRGRLEPRFAQELSDRHCWFRREGTWTLAHSRDRGIAAALHAGDAFLSRLEGEWWMRFHGG